MKKSTQKNLLYAGILLGGGYLIYKYLTGSSNKPPESNYPSYDFMKGATDYVMDWSGKAPGIYWNRSQVFQFNDNILENVPGAAQTQGFLNAVGIINRVNPFTRPVAPIIDRIFEITSSNINKYLGGG